MLYKVFKLVTAWGHSLEFLQSFVPCWPRLVGLCMQAEGYSINHLEHSYLHN